MATVQELLEPPISGHDSIDGVLGSYVRWEAGPADHALRYSFTPDVEFAGGPGVQVFNAAEETATRLVLTEVAAITGIEFIEIADGNAAQLTFVHDNVERSQFAVRSDMAVGADMEVTSYVPEGTVVIANSSINTLPDPYGGNASFYQLLLHEVGHAMDLKHPHDGFVMLEPGVGSNVHSVMTYRSTVSGRAQYSDYDVAALHWRFGTDGLGGESAWTHGADNVYGTLNGNDRLRGTSAPNHLFGNGGDDTLIGAGGNDVLVGWVGADTMNGGGGNDSYVVDAGDTLIDAGGVDTVYADMDWTLAAGFENLRFNVPLDFTTPLKGTGNASANLITGNAGGNLLRGFGGDDTLWGLDGADTLRGGSGSDLLVAGFGSDVLTGGGGEDRFVITQPLDNPDTLTDFATGGDEIHLDANVFFGLGAAGQFAAGDARFYAAPGAVEAHDVDDRLIFNPSSGQLFWDSDGNGSVTPAYLVATLQAGAAVSATDLWIDEDLAPGDLVLGTAASDALAGGSGNDRLDGLGGADSMSGGAGNDTYIVTAGDVLSDSAGVDWVFSHEGSWRLGAAFENLALVQGEAAAKGIGNALDNRMVGNQRANTLAGLGGDDTLIGGSGADRLEGSFGNDSLTGGTGADRFVFALAGTDNADILMDFGLGADTLLIDDARLPAIGPAGAFSAADARFYAAPGASKGHDASDRVVYDTASGALYYDANGSEAGGVQIVATLSGHPALAPEDIVVI